MVDKLKEAALIFKAKITKDEVQQLLLEATSDQNWQTPTNILHGLADAAYNYDQWQKISNFIWEKLKSKKWKKIIKTLNLIEFLLKNGPPSILSSFKYEVYQFKSFDGYNCYDDGVDRGQAIREKAKAIVELLTNEEFLQEERVKAKTIRERLAGTSSESMYSGHGSSSTGSRYGGTNYKNESTGNKYSGYGSGSKNQSMTNYTTGSYDQGKSTLDKYKNYSGGSLYSKENLNKDKEKEKEKEKQRKENKQKPEQKREEETVAPKAFEKQAPKLKKPGEIKAVPISPPTNNKSVNNTAITSTPVSKSVQNTESIDIFDFDAPSNPSPQTPVEPPKQVAPLPQQSQPVAQQQHPQTHSLVNQMYSATSQMANLNLLGTSQPQQNPTNLSLFNNQSNQYPQYINPMLPTTAPLAANVPLSQPTHQNLVNPMYPTTAPLAFPQQHQQSNQSQNRPLVNPMYPTTMPLATGNNVTPQPAKSSNAYNITMNTGINKPPSKEQDQFGGFESSSKNEVKWLSKDQTNLIDLNDLGKEMQQKKKDQNTRQAPPVKKKESNEGGLLATGEDFENFMSGPSATQPSYNISMNINNVNFGVPNVSTGPRPVVDPLLHMGNVMGGMQYSGYGQGYPQMTTQQYQQYVQQQQQQQLQQQQHQFNYRP